MPWLGRKRSSVERKVHTTDLVVLGNQINMASRRNGSSSQAKTAPLRLSSAASGRASRVSKKDCRQLSYESDFRTTFPGIALHAPTASPVKASTVDRAVQVDTIASCCRFDECCKILVTPEVDAEKHTLHATTGSIPVDMRRSSITFKSHRFIKVKEIGKPISRSGGKEQARFNRLLGNNDLVKFAEKLKMLADGFNSDSEEPPPDLKNSTYLLLKKTQEVVLVQCPEDLKGPSSNSAPVSDVDEELGSISRGSIASIDMTISDLSDVSPDIFKKKKTLYPVPCPAFPMEVSFPPVQFD